jgi:acetylornithine/succinyldiaminopimelate/putrescine aminotransferase
MFRPALPETLELIRRFNAEERATFLTSSNYMHADTAKLGYVLSERLLRGNPVGGDYRTFFVNSSLEALSGAIKLARQTSVRHAKADDGWVLLIDPEQAFAPFFDPTCQGSEAGLFPHVQVVDSVAAAAEQVKKRAWSAVIYVRQPAVAGGAALGELLLAARKNGTLIVSCDSELELSDRSFWTHGFVPDVVVYGENLTDRQLPFGCFTMTEAAHSVWNNDVDCFAQTSTFGGNRLCAAAALQALARHGAVSDAQRLVFQQLDGDFAVMCQYWGRHVNPGMAQLGPVFGMDMDVRSAKGGRLRLADGREIIDCSGGFGSNLRGHNPPDTAATLAAHEPGRDYFADLERLLTSLTKFDHAFPAVSGATAVDLAAVLGLLANQGRKKVVTFKGNFSGKTLFALNFSKHGPQLTESDVDAFRPYYQELVYIDPFAPDAEVELTKVLRGGDVALVWFEMLRGGMCELLPAPLLALVDRLKDECGYLIGVDEVLTGGWRSGDGYLAHAGTLRNSDIVTLGKTLSDMTTPLAAVLVTDAVWQRARAANGAHVERLRNHYRNPLTAQLALHALSQVKSDEAQAAMVRHQRIIEHGLRRLVGKSKLFSEVRGRGTLLVLVMNPRYFPFHHRSKPGNMLEMALAQLILERCGVFAFLLRFLHRVVTDEADANELVQRLERGLAGVTPLGVYRYALSRLFSMKLPRVGRLIEGRLTLVD